MKEGRGVEASEAADVGKVEASSEVAEGGEADHKVEVCLLLPRLETPKHRHLNGDDKAC